MNRAIGAALAVVAAVLAATPLAAQEQAQQPVPVAPAPGQQDAVRAQPAPSAETAPAPQAPQAQEQQELVDRARLALGNILAESNFESARSQMKGAKGVLIVPRLFKAGLFIGGEGGHGVLLVRQGDGSWSHPAFYTVGGGSFGLQVGIQDSQVLFILRTGKAVDAVLKDQVKVGGDISITVGTIGAGMEASTTSNLGADVVSYSLSRGAFGGGAFEGMVIARRSDFNEAYYGRPGLTPSDILFANSVSNPGADPLRKALAAY